MENPAIAHSASAVIRSRVAVAACGSYSSADVGSALDESMKSVGGIGLFVKPGETVLLNPNLFSPHQPADAVTTHPELVRQVIKLCFDAGAERVWVGDSPVGTYADTELWSRTGMAEAVEGTGAELKSFQVRQIPLACGEDTLVVPEWFLQVDAVISLPKLKTHCLTTITCGLKNIYGLVSGQAKSQFHLKYPSPLMMSQFLVRVFSVLKPRLTIADAVVAMEGNGPAHGSPLDVGVLIASADAVALDAVGCRALRISPSRVPMICLAAAEGLGRMSESEVEAIGSGVSQLNAVRMKASLAWLIRLIPEWAYAARLRLLRMQPKIRTHMCAKCGMCEEACPKQAISKDSTSGYPAIQRNRCIDCFCCLESCAASAIAVQYSFAKILRFTRRQRRGH